MNQVLERTRQEARSASTTLSTLRQSASEQAERISRSRKIIMKRDRLHDAKLLHACNKRTRRAVLGLEAIDALTQTDEVQELLLQAGQINLWGGYLHLPSHPDGEGGHYSSTTYEFSLFLTTKGVHIVDSTKHGGDEDLSDSTNLLLPYSGDSFIRHCRLASIATSSGCSPAYETDLFESLKGQDSEAPTAILFQVLADCANPRMLSKYFLKAIGRW